MVECNIDIGDKVYVGGIEPNDEYNHINGKVGVVNDILFVLNDIYAEYQAEVIIDNKSHFLNVIYLYNIEDFDSYIYDGLFDSSPYDYYFDIYDVVDEPIITFGENGINYLIAKTRKSTLNVFAINSLN